jgi:predicted metal-dependent hydrolase
VGTESPQALTIFNPNNTTEWLVNEAASFMNNKVELYFKELGVKPLKIKFKRLRSRWGSVTKYAAIHFNIDLLKAPADVIEYMILHELCPLEIKGHSHHLLL